MAEGRSRATREVWAKRVERWQDSGQAASEFARELGINPRTLAYWKYVLKRDDAAPSTRSPRRKAKSVSPAEPASSFVRVEASAPRSERFELELSSGRRLWVPASFDEAALQRLVRLLEAS
jgi:hypothetical protein